MKTAKHLVLSLVCFFGLSACVGTIVGTAVDVAIEVVKVPFKVGGAVVDVVTGEDLAEQKDENRSIQNEDDTDAVAEEQFAL